MSRHSEQVYSGSRAGVTPWSVYKIRGGTGESIGDGRAWPWPRARESLDENEQVEV